MRERAQALAEFAIVTPLLVLLLLGAFDVGTLVLERFIAQGAAQTVADLAAAGFLEDDPRITGTAEDGCPGGSWDLTYDDPLVSVEMTCPHLSPTSLLPDAFTVAASAVSREEVTPSDTPAP